jgi:hypothetical protein
MIATIQSCLLKNNSRIYIEKNENKKLKLVSKRKLFIKFINVVNTKTVLIERLIIYCRLTYL